MKAKRQQWTSRQNLDYYMFWIIRFKQHRLSKKKTRIFKEMTKFIPTKTPQQCRSHHEKMIGKKPTCSDKDQAQILQDYFRTYFCERQLGLDHLLKEISIFLFRAKKLNDKIKIEEEQQNLQKSLELLCFKNTMSDYHSQMESEQKGQTVRNSNSVETKIINPSNFQISSSINSVSNQQIQKQTKPKKCEQLNISPTKTKSMKRKKNFDPDFEIEEVEEVQKVEKVEKVEEVEEVEEAPSFNFSNISQVICLLKYKTKTYFHQWWEFTLPIDQI